MDGITGRRPLLIIATAIVLAAALAVTGPQLTGTAGLATADAAELPTVTVDPEANQLLDGLPHDGLNRFVLTLSDPTAVVDGEVAVEQPGEQAADVAFTDRDDPSYLDRDELSVADEALLAQLQGLDGDGGSAAWDVDALSQVEGIESVTPAGPGFAAVATSLSADQVAGLPGVDAVDADDLRHLSSAVYYDRQWGLHNTTNPGADIRWEAASSRADGSGVVVAVVDSGVDADHPDLASQWWTNADEACGNGVDDDGNGYVDDCNGWDFANNDPTVDDSGANNDHGTHVSGIIAATRGDYMNGVAPGARIMPLKIFHNGASNSSRLAAAINYAVDNGADVINLSLGGDNGTAAEEAALQRASAAGIAVVVAAGNDGRNIDVVPSYPAHYDLPVIISVGSSDDDDTASSFSNHGATEVDLFAPGGQILSAVPGGLAFMSGTSMATPFVSGAAAMVVQRGERGAQVRTTLMETAKPLQALEGLAVSGARLDAAAAVGVPRGNDAVPEVTFESFDDLVDGTADEAVVSVTAEVDALDVDGLTIRGTLGAVYQGEVYGVIEFPLAVDGAEVTTDGQGQFLLAEQLVGTDVETLRDGGVALPLDLTLPAGQYAMAVELLPAGETSADPVVLPSLIFFEVAPPPVPVQDQPGGADPGAPPSGGATGDPPPTSDDPVDLPGGSQPPSGGEGPSDDDGVGGGTPNPQPDAPGVVVVDPGDGSDDPPSSGGSGGTTPPGDGVGSAPPGSGGSAATTPPPGSGSPDGTTPPPGNGGSDGPIPAPGNGGSTPPSGGAPSSGDPGSDGPAPAPPSDDPPSDTGEEVVGTVSPSQGDPYQIAVVVTVPSGIHPDAYVHFDGSNAPILARIGSSRVLVEPPPHQPGTVDVAIVHGETRKVIPGGYTYLPAPGGTTPAPQPAPDPGTATPSPGDSTPPTESSPPSGSQPPPDSGASQPPSTGGSQPSPGDSTPPDSGDSPPPDGGASPPPPGDGSDPDPSPAPPSGPFTYNGLTLNVLSDGNPLQGVPGHRVAEEACTQPVCAARTR